MKLEITNKDVWINEQLEILNEEYTKYHISLTSKEEVDKWLDSSDLIQVLTENFDYSADLSEATYFSNEEFIKQFNDLFQNLKNEITDRFFKQISTFKETQNN